MRDLSAAHEPWVANFEPFAARWRKCDPAWLVALREDAIAAFAEQGFPTRRREEWRTTNVAPIAAETFALAKTGERTALDRRVLEFGEAGAATQMVFVDGAFRPDLSPGVRDSSVTVESLAVLRRNDPALLEGSLGAQVDLKHHPFAALATAFLDDGAVVVVPRAEQAPAPIWLRFLPGAGVGGGERSGKVRRVCFPRVLLKALPESRAQVVVDFASVQEGPHLTNVVVEVDVGANASLDLVAVQRESAAAFHVSLLQARLQRAARFSSHVLTLGGGLVRNDLEVLLEEEGADCTLRGLFATNGSQRVDNQVRIDHAVSHGTSCQLYKGILGAESRGVFRGRVLVRPGAVKTDATQSNPNLLTSDAAEVDTQPQLEIYADDVKCGHGSTIGQLEPEAIFYLRSRGIDESAAREILIGGFAREILADPPVDGVEAAAEELLERRLRGETTGAPGR